MSYHDRILHMPCAYSGGNPREHIEGFHSAQRAAAEIAAEADAALAEQDALIETLAAAVKSSLRGAPEPELNNWGESCVMRSAWSAYTQHQQRKEAK